MSVTQQRSVIRAVVFGTTVAALLVVAWVAAAATGIIAPTYRLGVSVIAQGTSRYTSIKALNAAVRQVQAWVPSSVAARSESTSELPAITRDGSPTHDWIAIAHFSASSTNLSTLNKAVHVLQNRSKWPVTDLDLGGEFTQVIVRPGVTQPRLSEAVANPGSGIHVRLQTTGPSVTFSLTDAVPICLIALLLVGFGATERNASDVFAFPRGMQPIVVCCQLLSLGLLCCVFVSYLTAGESGFSVGLFVLNALVVINMTRWLWVSGSSWRTETSTLLAHRMIIAVTACVTIAGFLIAGGVFGRHGG